MVHRLVHIFRWVDQNIDPMRIVVVVAVGSAVVGRFKIFLLVDQLGGDLPLVAAWVVAVLVHLGILLGLLLVLVPGVVRSFRPRYFPRNLSAPSDLRTHFPAPCSCSMIRHINNHTTARSSSV